MTAHRKSEEARFGEKCANLARTLGWIAIHFHDSRRQVRTKDGRRIMVGDKDAKGWPDWTFIHEGRGILLFRELKVPPNDLTDDQTRILNALAATGADVDVWRPADWPLIEATFNRRNPS